MEKTVAGYGMEISFDKSKILVHSTVLRPSTNIWMNHVWDEWKSVRKSLPAQILGMRTKQGWNIIEESKSQTGTLNNDKTSSTMENKAISFHPRIKLCKSLVLSILL